MRTRPDSSAATADAMAPRPVSAATRRGFALPMVILVIAILTAGVAASFTVSGAEVATTVAQRGQQRAFAIAQSGLEQFVKRRKESGFCSICTTNNPGTPTLPESTMVVMRNGYAWVSATPVRPATDSTIGYYLLRSRGVDTTTRLSGDLGTSYAERTVAMYATWSSTNMNVLSSWTSLSGIRKAGTGTISGEDECNAKSDVAGLSVPKGDLIVTQAGWSPLGTPPADTFDNLATLKNRVKIDWAGILAGAITPDITISSGSTGWPTSSQWADTSYWPVVRFTGSNSLPSTGRGIIIADSNFDISGSREWDGIILVGGRLTSNGNNTSAGASVSGLNLLIGGTADPGDADANGQKRFVYNSCNVARAAAGMAMYSIVGNAWMDNLAGW